ncbi:MAG: hypothetical protein KDA45_16755, partial [Planctomycetales bacterium]|nr:hypothetical protein [Planctomycetales bacterium]
MRSKSHIPSRLALSFHTWGMPCAMWLVVLGWSAESGFGQRIQFPDTPSGLRPIAGSQQPYPSTPAMVPINPATQAGIYPPSGPSSTGFDPYANAAAGAPALQAPAFNSTIAPPTGFTPSYPGTTPLGGYPNYSGPPPVLPGAGQSGVVGTFPNNAAGYNQPGVYPNSSPSALFPGPSYGNGAYGNGGGFGSFWQSIFGNSSGSFGGNYGQPSYPTMGQPAYPGGGLPQPAGGGYFNPNT